MNLERPWVRWVLRFLISVIVCSTIVWITILVYGKTPVFGAVAAGLFIASLDQIRRLWKLPDSDDASCHQ
jgi:hypothetical protein